MLNSSKEEAEEIRKNIITGNLRLVVETIKKYRNNVEDQKDLFQIGCIGLIKAVDTFDVTKNMMFSTYATVCISNRVKEYLRKGNMNCGVLGQLKIKIDEYSDEIYKTTGVNPTTEQISEYFNIPHNKVCKALNIRQIESLDNKLIDSESASYADLISTCDVAHLDTKICAFLVSCCFVTSSFHIVCISCQNLFCAFTFEIFRFFTITDDQNLWCQIECRNFEIGFLVVVSVYQIIVIQFTHVRVFFT